MACKGNYNSTLTGRLRARAQASSNRYSLVRPEYTGGKPKFGFAGGQRLKTHYRKEIQVIFSIYILTVLQEYAARGTRACFRQEVPPEFKAK